MNESPSAPSPARLRRYQMTLADWNDLWVLQEGKCYLCQVLFSDDIKRVHIDHDHRCCGSLRACYRCLRGLACSRCNLVIGMVGESAELLKRIALYLETTYQDCSWHLWPGTPWRELYVSRLGTETR
jgi:hypothetical protein